MILQRKEKDKSTRSNNAAYNKFVQIYIILYVMQLKVSKIPINIEHFNIIP